MHRLAFLALALVGACRGTPPADLARTTTAPLARSQGRFVAVNGLQLFAIVTGGGRDVVLIHGNPASTYTWRKVIPGLAQHFRVHAVDLPGWGFSDKPADAPYTAAWLAEQVVGYLDAAHVARPVVVGSSMGGLVASEVAIRHPDRVGPLILIDPAGLPEAEVQGQPLLFRLLGWPLIGRVVGMVPGRGFTADGLHNAVFDPSTVTETDVDEYYAPLRTAGGLNAFVARLSQPTPPERAQQVAGITSPTLVVTGDTDRVIPPATARRYHALIPGSELLVLPQTGHLPQEERPERVVAEVTRWADAHP